MSRTPPPDPEETEFDSQFGPAFEAIRKVKGECPDCDVLAGYLAGGLPHGEAERIRQHVAACGRCDWALTRMKAFEAAITAKRSRWSWLRGPLPGYALAAVLAAALLLRFPSNPPASVPPAAIQTARSFDLALETRVSGAQPTRVTGNEPVFILSVAIPVRKGFHYSAEVEGKTMAPAVAWEGAEQDTVRLACDRRLFPRGEYTLVVTESETGLVFRSRFIVE